MSNSPSDIKIKNKIRVVDLAGKDLPSSCSITAQY